MDQHSGAHPGDTRSIEDGAIPTARQVLTRSLATAGLLLLSWLLVGWLLFDFSGELRTPWWPVVIVVWFAVVMAFHRITRAPRPRLTARFGGEYLQRAVTDAARHGEVPSDPGVRAAAGVLACRSIEAAVGGVAVLVGVIITAVVWPAVPWLTASIVSTLLVVVFLLRARLGWRYLNVVHGQTRTA